MGLCPKSAVLLVLKILVMCGYHYQTADDINLIAKISGQTWSTLTPFHLWEFKAYMHMEERTNQTETANCQNIIFILNLQAKEMKM